MCNTVVYGWFHDGQIFYIGIGSLKRSKARNGRNPYCKNKRNKAEKERTFEVRILQSGLTKKEACDIECQLIQQYGRIDNGTGILTNMTNGGEEGVGQKHSIETRQKMSNSRSGKKHYNYGKRASKETLERMSQAQKGKKISKKTREKISKANKGSNNSWFNVFGKDNPRSKPVKTPIGEFDSLKQAAEAYGVSSPSIGVKVRDKNNHEYYYL